MSDNVVQDNDGHVDDPPHGKIPASFTLKQYVISFANFEWRTCMSFIVTVSSMPIS